MARKVWPLLIVALLGVFPARSAGQLVQGPEVTEVRFEGNATFPADSLSRAIVTREQDCRAWVFAWFGMCALGLDFALDKYYLRDEELPRDRVRLEIWYQRRGFRDASVNASSSVNADGTARVLFRITEGTPVVAESIDFLGTEELTLDGLLDDLPLREGDRLSTLALDASRDTLIRRLRNRGRAHAEVLRHFTIRNDDPYHANVAFDILAGPQTRYGAITVTGNNELSESTILRTLEFRSGDPYRVDQLLDGQARLFGLEIVRTAQVSADLGSPSDTLIPVNVQVQEAEAYRVRAGSGWTSAECFNVESSWTSRDFMGGGRLLQVRGRLSNLLAPQFGDLLCPDGGSGRFDDLTWFAAVDFAQPWIFSTRNALSASLFAERQSLPDIFIRRSVGLQVALTRAIGPRTPLTLAYRPERTRLEAAEILFCTGFLACTPEDIGLLSATNWLAPIGLNFTRDRSDDLLNPSSGYRMIIDLEHAASWTGSDFRYDRVAVEGAWYESLTGSTVLATRLRGGWVGSGGFDRLIGPRADVDLVHPQKRFYAGGANSVRGFPQSRLGPRVLTVDPDLLVEGPAPEDEEPIPAPCTPAEVIDLSCDASSLDEGALVPRPVGGTRVLEGNLEVRFGLGRRLQGVVFTDFGQVWAANDVVALDDLEFAPGVGLRFLSPIGPIRIDLGYRFRGAERLPVLTSQLEPAGPGDCERQHCYQDPSGAQYVRSDELAVLGPLVLFGESASHFQLHFSIGQAF